MGDWLRVNGEAIYATRPWKHYKQGDGIRFTQSKDHKYVYAISLQWPGRELTLKHVKPRTGSPVLLLGVSTPLAWHIDANGALIVDIPDRLQSESNRPCRQVYAFKIEPAGD